MTDSDCIHLLPLSPHQSHTKVKHMCGPVLVLVLSKLKYVADGNFHYYYSGSCACDARTLLHHPIHCITEFEMSQQSHIYRI